MPKEFKLVLSDGAFKQLKLLQEKTESKDMADTIRMALSRYDALTDALVNDGVLFVRWPDGSEQEVTFM